jgi:hypothetical protein
MDIDHQRVQELLDRLAEGLNVEVKKWISPWQRFSTNEEARAALATPASLSALNETG